MADKTYLQIVSILIGLGIFFSLCFVTTEFLTLTIYEHLSRRNDIPFLELTRVRSRACNRFDDWFDCMD